jgi:hypothetical protein
MKSRKAGIADRLQPLPPTGKAFTLSMTAIGRRQHGVMVEEWLFRDNQAFMQQIGLTP